MILYFREDNGDYLAIETDSNRHYLRMSGKDQFEVRATAIAGLVSSVCTTGVSREFLQSNCKRVSKTKVPVEWCKAIGY